MKKLVLIDSNALVHRAFHAIPMLTAPDGRPTNAAYGFLSVLLKMVAELKPDYIAAAFDLPGPTFRHKEFKEYKAQRAKAPDELYAQIPLVQDLLKVIGIPVYELAGYEADDILGTIARLARDVPDLQTIIVTGDLDTLQLVQGKKTVVLTLRKGMSDIAMYDEATVRERYGLDPSQVADFKGLKGDPSDNIPGVTGIGDKTASALVGTFGSLERLYEELEKPAFAKKAKSKGVSEKLLAKLLEQREMALFSKKLATIMLDVPLDWQLDQADWHRRLDLAALEKSCKELGFYSLAKRVATVFGKAAAEVSIQSLDLDGTRTALPPFATTAAANPTDLPAGDTAVVQAVITEGTIRSLFLTTDGESVFSLDSPTPERCQEALLKYRTLVAHDLKPLARLLPKPELLASHELVDTGIAAWLASPDQRDYSLERVYYEVAGETLAQDPAAWAAATWRLRPLVTDRLRTLNLVSIFEDIEMPLIPVLAAMEGLGIRVDTKTIQDLLVIAASEVSRLEQEIWKLAGGEFNINSPAQLADILFTRLSIKGRVRRTGGGRQSTAAPELEKLRDEHPIIDLVLSYREMSKLKTTYIEPFPALVGADGRIHTSYHQVGTATGRLSSSDPNLQNVPTRTELGQRFRAAFIADPGWKLVSLDYSQLELRLVAHMAKDETMAQAFRAGEDIHTRTASEILGIPPAGVTKEMRRQAKVLNFGMIYGMGVQGFARAAGVGRDEARRFMDEYFARFKGVAHYMERTKQEAFEHGYVSTLLGRRRPLPDITSGIPQLAASAERMAINHPIQGTGADLMKMAMLAVDRHLRESDLGKDARMLLTVHDELVLEVRTEAVERAAGAIRHIMETVHPLDVPLVVDVKVGDNWSQTEPLTHAGTPKV